MTKSPDKLMAQTYAITDADLIAIRDVATDVRAIQIINELLNLRQKVKEQTISYHKLYQRYCDRVKK